VHDNVLLNGPVWLFAQFVILGGVLMSVYVLVDSLRPARRAAAAGRLREPIAVYTALTGAYLALLVAVQVIPGLQLASAVVSIATPFALALGIAYLLRVVFPKPQASASQEPEEEPASDSGE